MAIRVEPFGRDVAGRPVIGADDASLYRFGSLIRAAEELILDLFRRNLVSGTTHTCIGQEICQIAVARALRHEADTALSNHRNHGHFLAFTGEFVGLVAETMGRAAGACGGYGGSQHLAGPGFHSSGVQGGLTAIGVGGALHRARQGSAGLTAVFIGDGTLGEGLLYESLNLAAIWSAPVLFVVEDNGIAQTTPTKLTTAGSIRARGEAFGIATWQFDDAALDFTTEIEHVVGEVRERRAPALVVIETRRLGPHSKGDDLRPPEELSAIVDRDPLSRVGARLAPQDRQVIDDDVRSFIAGVEATALASPPARGMRATMKPWPVTPGIEPAAPAGTFRQSLNRSLGRLLASDPDAIVLGQDLHAPYGGAFKVTEGLSERFADRVISTPISEAGLVGAAIGLALAGRTTVAEIMFADFMGLAFDQILNQAVKFHDVFGARVPLVIRTATGGRRGYGPTHSQSTEALIAAIPGMTVVVPSHRHDPGELLARAAAIGKPVGFFEHKTLYGLSCEAGGYVEAPADPRDDGARVFPMMTRGPAAADVTIVAIGGAAPEAESAAVQLEAEGLSVRIVIPALIAPFPARTLGALLDNTPILVVVEESAPSYGVGAELGAVMAERGYRGQFARVGAMPVAIPAARALEAEVLPNAAAIVAAVESMIDRSTARD